MSADPPASPRRALDGIRVLDLSRVLAGPYCCQLLGDHGADVIKIESPGGDDTRTFGPPYVANGASAYYTGINRNKRNLCLDLSTPRGQSVLRELLAHTDVIVENFKPGTMERWGLGFEEHLAPAFPRLVHCRITGYGVTGPLGGRPGYDAVLQAYSGLMSINGQPDGAPVRLGVPVVDLVTGLHAFGGIMLALHERASSGRGQLVDCALLDTALSLLHPHSASWLADGRVPRRTGSAHPTVAPYDSFTTATGPIFIGAGNDRQFRDLVHVAGRPELADDVRFATNRDRVVNVGALTAELGAVFASWDRDELADRLLRVGVPAAPVNDVAAALSSAQAEHREMVVRLGEYTGVGIPLKLSATPGSVARPPAALGEHTREVLRAFGHDDAEIERLIDDGVAFAGDDPAITRAPRRG
ncbi:CaiB/BaiF CoA transferase family protein [Acrocarpospora catenulata]|uniref:CaiB/BaiF CoA transferase family protein n=1 Tax=Acrocarpospora catenulata TaxID=2836182 RepID=UPI001BDA87B1|nr:CoA transferase [Acrocarpospora catenulata]